MLRLLSRAHDGFRALPIQHGGALLLDCAGISECSGNAAAGRAERVLGGHAEDGAAGGASKRDLREAVLRRHDSSDRAALHCRPQPRCRNGGGRGRNGKYDSLNEDPEGAVFYPASQSPKASTVLLVRSALPTAALAPALRSAVAAVDPGLPVEILPSERGPDDGVFSGAGGDGVAGCDGAAGGHAGHHGRLRHGGVQREPADARAWHSRGAGCAPRATDARRAGTAAGAAAFWARWRGWRWA